MLTWIDIDHQALQRNFQIFAEIVGREALAPVVKANAYGHDLATVYSALATVDPAWLCVNYVEEAKQLRDLGFKNRILVVGPALPEVFGTARAAKAELTIGNFEVLRAWLKEAPGIDIHIKIDSGLSRQGFFPDQLPEVLDLLDQRRDSVKGISMHFANVEDVTEHAYAEEQLRRFANAVEIANDRGFKLLRHASSSASTLLLTHSRFDLCRVGISMYGFWPSQATRLSWLRTHKQLAELQPVLQWRTKVATVKGVRSGDFVGYGCTFRAVRDMQVAVLPVGYFEGYPRLTSDHPSYVLIRGKRCPLVGRICMNMMVVDISHLDDVEVGDTVTLIGSDGDEFLAAEEVAGWAQTIHYELVSRLNPEIPRRKWDK
jgi:alanine racemase